MAQWEIRFDLAVELRDPVIVGALAKIEALARVIHGVPLPPVTRDRIDALNIMRAVRGTTGIEGTEVSEEEVERIMAAPAASRVLSSSRQREEQEVRNAEQVMRFVARVVKEDRETPVTEDLIREIHSLTTQGIDYPYNEPGRYRDHGVSAGSYVPPRTGEEVQRLMSEFVRWLNSGPPRGWPGAVKAVAAHFYFISIHPFGDGNGRTARGLESFLLYQGGLNARGFYSLANFYYQNHAEYVSLLDLVRFESGGDLTPFLRFALTGLVAEQEGVHEEVLAAVTEIAFRDFARGVLSEDGKLGTKPGERMFHFLLQLPGAPVPIVQLRRGGHPLSVFYRGVTVKTLTRDLHYLQSRGLIVIEDGLVQANLGAMNEFMT